MPKQVEIQWLSAPEEHNYPAALSYLSLLYDEQTATTYVDRLKRASISEFKAKDIFRASGLSLLGVSNGRNQSSAPRLRPRGEAGRAWVGSVGSSGDRVSQPSSYPRPLPADRGCPPPTRPAIATPALDWLRPLAIRMSKKDQQKLQSGRALSPLLLTRDSVNGKVVIAGGYHRLCAVYSCDEDAVIPCKIV